MNIYIQQSQSLQEQSKILKEKSKVSVQYYWILVFGLNVEVFL